MKFLLTLLMLVRVSTAQPQEFWLDFRLGFASPDGFERPVIITRYGENDEAPHTFPGPEIRVIEGRLAKIHVCNNLPSQAMSIHWHGQHVEGHPWSDGLPYVTQCPIQPGSCFMYEFMPGPTGTFFWHGHLGAASVDGMSGPFIVDVDPSSSGAEPFSYDEELTLMLADWWHAVGDTKLAGLQLRNAFRWVGPPDSILINGRANCPTSIVGTDACNATLEGLSEFQLQSGVTYRLRLIAGSSLSLLNVAIQDHQMEVVEADGHYVTPRTVDSLDMHTGQRYSVLFTPTSTGTFWLRVRELDDDIIEGRAIFRVGDNTTTSTTTFTDAVDNTEAQLTSLNGPTLPTTVSRVVTYNTTTQPINGYLSYTLNGVAFSNRPHVPYLLELERGTLEIEQPGLMVQFELGETVDVIVNNFDPFTHPWHLHGGSYWVLGTGQGVYDDALHSSSLNLVNPVYRDTATASGLGWLYLRYTANNPGVWFFHCHVLWHLEMGMGTLFVVGDPEDIPPHPEHFPVCGTKETVCPIPQTCTNPKLTVNFNNLPR